MEQNNMEKTNMERINMGILGAGNIAGKMAATVQEMETVHVYAIGSRDQQKAENFAEKYGIPKAYGSYEELVKDKNIDLIYVATPHSEHYDHARLCLENGKAVLCEKAFTANAVQAEKLVALAREKHILLAEAIWTRYMPMLQTIREVLASGVIGEPTMLTANLGYVISHVRRVMEPALAGGALLDLGVYALNFAAMIFGTQVEKVTSDCVLTDTGVDEQNGIIVTFKDGKVAVLASSIVGQSDRKGIIYGTKGYMAVEDITSLKSLGVYDSDYNRIALYERPKQISGYEYEVEACVRSLEAGKIECDEMPHDEVIRIMKMMDQLRKQWGVKYPFEE